MTRLDHVVDEGRFRASPSAALVGATGTWGTTDGDGVGDLLCVALDGNGELILATADDCVGVIWVPEGRRDTFRIGYPRAQHVALCTVENKPYTVFERAIISDVESGEDPLAPGDVVYSAADGGIDDDPSGVFLGYVVPNPVDGGARLILRVPAGGGFGGS